MLNRETITRRNLPHWYVPGAWHFVTYRLAGSIPQHVLLELREKRIQRLDRKSPQGVSAADHRARVHKQFFAEYDRYLDRHSRIDWLRDPRVAAPIRENLYHHNGSKYHLLAYCVMPNHVHVLLRPMAGESQARPLVATTNAVAASGSLAAGAKPQARPPVATGVLLGESVSDEMDDSRSPLSEVMHSLKSYTAHKANALLGRSGQFWQVVRSLGARRGGTSADRRLHRREPSQGGAGKRAA